jgi:anti-sigma28 factor (negative regulator of flagellin synthesis)
MKIDNNTLQAISPSPIGTTALTGGKTQSGARQSGGDKVQISDMAALLSADPQKLAQLTAAVQNGTYNISPSQIANSMINEMMAG